MQMNETDKNDAHGLAQIVKAGWYREVGVKAVVAQMSDEAGTLRNRCITSTGASILAAKFRFFAAVTGEPRWFRREHRPDWKPKPAWLRNMVAVGATVLNATSG